MANLLFPRNGRGECFETFMNIHRGKNTRARARARARDDQPRVRFVYRAAYNSL